MDGSPSNDNLMRGLEAVYLSSYQWRNSPDLCFETRIHAASSLARKDFDAILVRDSLAFDQSDGERTQIAFLGDALPCFLIPLLMIGTFFGRATVNDADAIELDCFLAFDKSVHRMTPDKSPGRSMCRT